ncbi:hypothetical protein ACLMAL_11445 [Nocardia sp. CWNU-33]|uniref:hypothetical protein n=1 Tax=Nocardia sp. CWNU-33 TaxID=3392117 RepID=UPI00398E5BE5
MDQAPGLLILLFEVVGEPEGQLSFFAQVSDHLRHPRHGRLRVRQICLLEHAAGSVGPPGFALASDGRLEPLESLLRLEADALEFRRHRLKPVPIDSQRLRHPGLLHSSPSPILAPGHANSQEWERCLVDGRPTRLYAVYAVTE